LGACMGDAQLCLLVAHPLPCLLTLRECLGGLLPPGAVREQLLLQARAPCAQLLGLGMRFLDLRLQLGAAALELLAGARDTRVLAGAAALVRARPPQVRLEGVDARPEPAERLLGGCRGLRRLRARLRATRTPLLRALRRGNTLAQSLARTGQH